MRLKVESEIDITPEELADKMFIDDIGAFLSALASKMEGDFVNRPFCISEFEKTLSEEGALFLAEIVTLRYSKKKK